MLEDADAYRVKHSLPYAIALKSNSQVALAYLINLNNQHLNKALILNPALGEPARLNLTKALLAQDCLTSADAYALLDSNLTPPTLIKQVAQKDRSYHSIQLLQDQALYTDQEALAILKEIHLTQERTYLWELVDHRPSLTPDLASISEDLNTFATGYQTSYSSFQEAAAGSRHLFDKTIQKAIFDRAKRERQRSDSGQTSPDWQTLFTLLANPNTDPELKAKIYLVIERQQDQVQTWGIYDTKISRKAIFINAQNNGVLRPANQTPWEELTGQPLQDIYLATLLLSPDRYPTLKPLLSKIKATKPLPESSLAYNHYQRAYPQKLEDFKLFQTPAKPVPSNGIGDDDNSYTTSFHTLRADTIDTLLTPALDLTAPASYQLIFELSQNFTGNLAQLLDNTLSLLK